MCETKFTKGEWFVRYDKNLSSTIDVYSGMVMVSYHGHYTEEAIANAHLIAAAPEMYEILLGVRDCISLGQAECIGLLEIENVLAKARGEHV